MSNYRKNIELPLIEHWTAKILAKTYTIEDFFKVIIYLEKVIDKFLIPGREILALGIDPRNYTIWELQAVQNRMIVAIIYKRKENTSMTGNVVVTDAHQWRLH